MKDEIDVVVLNIPILDTENKATRRSWVINYRIVLFITVVDG